VVLGVYLIFAVPPCRSVGGLGYSLKVGTVMRCITAHQAK